MAPIGLVHIDRMDYEDYAYFSAVHEESGHCVTAVISSYEADELSLTVIENQLINQLMRIF